MTYTVELTNGERIMMPDTPATPATGEDLGIPGRGRHPERCWYFLKYGRHSWWRYDGLPSWCVICSCGTANR